ncbi:MAG: hypothetical protein ACR2PZ_12435 [Pseudomonadales bacterium]
MERLGLLIFGNVLFVLGVISYFFASEPLGLALGAFGLVLEAGGVMQLIKHRQSQ